jgi:hypothetical protein
MISVGWSDPAVAPLHPDPSPCPHVPIHKLDRPFCFVHRFALKFVRGNDRPVIPTRR